MTPSALDISGLEVLQASPQRAVRAARHILHRPPPVGDFISVTGSSGDRVYLAKREDEEAGRVSEVIAGLPEPAEHPG